MDTYFVLSGDVGLKPINLGDAGEGKQQMDDANIIVT
jgi:hypothetical protein